jgi:2-oxo-3-hexenedioate decarboxylase/2-keto-4-pentenoate hydratase
VLYADLAVAEGRPVQQTSVVPDDEAVVAAADRLEVARSSRIPCPPVRDLIGATDLQAAYAVQREVARRRTDAGRTVVGRKIGLTSAAVQAQLGVDQPDFGVLLDDMHYADGDLISMSALLQPRVEAEVAFVLGEDLSDGELGIEQVSSAVDHMLAALEVVDSRVAGWDISFADTVADNASAGVFVLGTTPVTLDRLDPRDVQMTMRVTGQEDSTGDGVACLGNPLLALQWLARQARDLGEPLRAGQVVLSGALGPMRAVTPGATADATISGLGEVRAHFDTEGQQ